MMIGKVSRFLFGTLRGRLIIGVAAVHAAMMSFFVVDLTARQRGMLQDRQVEQATALSQALATSAAGWIVADDVSGLQELVAAQLRYPESLFAILADREGRVMADTDESRQGLYLLDLPRGAQQTVIVNTPALVDVATPAMIGGRHVGWARVGVGQEVAGKRLAEIVRSGVFYALAAILVGSVIAWFMGRRITRRLYAVQETIEAVRSGNRQARSLITGSDEAAVMAREFNSMLDALEERNSELRASEDRYRSLIQKVQAAIVLHDGHGRVLNSNLLAQDLLGLSADQLLGKSLIDPDWHFLQEDGSILPVARYPVSLVLTTRRPLRDHVNGIRRPDRTEASWVLVNAEPEYDDAGEIALVIVSFVDITERRRAEDSVRLMGIELQTIYDNTYTLLAYLDRDFNFLRVNRAYAEADGKSPESFVGKNHFELYPSTENEAIFRGVVETGQPYAVEAKPFVYPEHPEWGVTYWDWTLVPVFSAERTVTGLIFTLLNVTKRKRAEEALRRLNRELRAISECNQVLVRAEDEQTLLNDICRIVCDEAGYRSVWVGYAEYDDAKTVRPVAWAGFEDGYIANARLSWADDTERGRGPGGTAIRSGEIVYVQDFSTDPRMAPWREDALQRGYRSAIALPLKDESASVFGVLIIYSAEINAFTPDELRLLEELSGDLAFGIMVLRTRIERKQAEEERLSHLRYFEIMDRINRATQGTNDLEQMTSDVLAAVLSIFDCDRAFLLYPCDPEAASWHVPMERTKPEYPGALALGIDVPMDEEVAETLGILLDADGPVEFGPGTRHPLPAEVSRRFGFQSLMSMALHPKVGMPWQFGIHQCSYARIWTPEEERFLREIGRRLTDALTSLLTYRTLRESEARLAEAQRIANLGNWEWDIPTNTLWWSDETYRIFEIDPKEFGATFDAYINAVHTEDRERVQASIGQALQEDSEGWQIDYRIARADGSIRFVHEEGETLFDRDGRPLKRRGTVQDITDRKRAEEALRASEQKYRLLVANASEAIFIVQDGVVEFPNTRTLELTGYSAEELAKIPFAHLIHPDERAAAVQRHLQRPGVTGPSEAHRFRILDKQGKQIWTQLTAAEISWEEKPGTLCFLRDITEEKKLEAQFLQAQKMEALGQLAGGVAHDFNNLLQVILGYVEVLQGELDENSEAGEALDEVRQSALRAADLTRQLLAFSRRQVIQPVNLDVNDLIQGVLKMIRRVIGEHIDLCYIPGGRLGAIYADRGQLEQVLMNLCVNARDAMSKGGTLTIETENVVIGDDYCREHPWAVEGRYVLLSVTDTGVGMDEATRAQIFEPFFTTKDVGQGTGLGLATVYGIVKQHSGLIHVYSEQEKGTAFKIYIPISERRADVVESKIERRAVGGTETILVAEDEEAVRKLVSHMLMTAGYTVLTARDGEDALRVFEEHADSIDLALLDVMMPKLGGRSVMDRIQAKRPEIRVLFSSGYTQNALDTNFVVKEGLRLITKPYRRADLLRAIRDMLDAPQGGPCREPGRA